MDIARKNNIKRIIRCSQIMGRSETDELSAAQIFYPCMQCADIFFLKARDSSWVCYVYVLDRREAVRFTRLVDLLPQSMQADICQLGMDQRKVNVLAREYADDARPKRIKPVILSHPMMPGLLQVTLRCQ